MRGVGKNLWQWALMLGFVTGLIKGTPAFVVGVIAAYLLIDRWIDLRVSQISRADPNAELKLEMEKVRLEISRDDLLAEKARRSPLNKDKPSEKKFSF